MYMHTNPTPSPPPQEDTWEDIPPIPDTTAVGMCSLQLLWHRSQSSGGHTVGHHQDSDYTQGGRVVMSVGSVRVGISRGGSVNEV